MIVSHKYKCIFIKPTKVAGTSLEIALAKQCGPDDIITPISKFDPATDSTPYEQPAQNYEAEGFYNHMTPMEVQERVGQEVWDSYYKFTIVRDPWDIVISRYYWQQRHGTPLTKLASPKKLRQRMFEPASYWYVLRRIARHIQGRFVKNQTDDLWLFLGSFRPAWTNDQFYFAADGSCVCDEYIHYENLEESYRVVCDTLGIPHTPLPQTKNKLRSERSNTKDIYTARTSQMVERLFAKQIAKFGFTSPISSS